MQAVNHSSAPNRRLWPLLIVVSVLVTGLVARVLFMDSSGLTSTLSEWLPWLRGMPVTLYFGDGRFMVPVSRNLSGDADSPQTLVEAMLAGPDKRSGLVSLIPDGTTIRDLSVEAGLATLDLSSELLQGDLQPAALALTWSLLSWPGIQRVQILAEGAPLTLSSQSATPLFFVHNHRLVAVPTTASTPRAALDAYLDDPPAPDLVGLPSDVGLVSYGFNEANGLLALNFTYTQSLREYAVANPDSMRRVLIGLIAMLTAFPEVKAVTLDFEGHSQLGLGQCANLLRAPQTRPEVLNDARLLGG